MQAGVRLHRVDRAGGRGGSGAGSASASAVGRKVGFMAGVGSTGGISTSLQRTYRNLRLGIAGTVVVIGVAVAVTSLGTGVLPSISAYYYTPARNLLVGALVAAAFGILVLSGRGLQRALLDAAASFAPLIALVPTAAGGSSFVDDASDCASGTRCLPASALPDVEVGVWSYLVVGVLVLMVAAGVTASRSRSEGSGVWRAVGPSLGVAAVVLVAVGATWMLARHVVLQWGHLMAAVAFFGLIAAVAVTNAVSRPSPAAGTAAADRAGHGLRRAYLVIAVALVVDLVLTVVAVAAGFDGGDAASGGSGVPVLLIGEAVALALFAAFWVLQSLQRWNDPDPALR